MTQAVGESAVGHWLRKHGRLFSIVCLTVPVVVVAVIDVFRIEFVQPGDADNFSSHATAWLAVAIVCSLGLVRRIWAPDTEPNNLLSMARTLITLAATVVALDAMIDVVIIEFVLRQRIDNLLGAPAFLALPVALVGLVLELIGVARSFRSA